MKNSTAQIIEIAKQYANNSSALFCIAQAESVSADYARMWALKSLAHSLGILHPIYQENL